jgi:hypothetical protein
MNYCCYDTDQYVAVSADDRAWRLLDKICAGNNITVSLGWTPWSRCVVIDWPDIHDPTVVTSVDNTVTVTYDAPTNTYDLSVNCCDQEDKFVAVWVGCTPDYLENVLVPQAGWPITITKVWCDLEVGFNPAVIPDLDKKVAVQSTCDWEYLEDALLDGFGTLAVVSGCTMKIDIDETWEKFFRPWARITLQDNQFYDCGTIWDFDTVVLWMTDTAGNDAGMHVNSNIITITKAWPYRVSFSGKVEVNDHIVAFRVSLNSSRNEYDWVIDHKYWAGSTNGSITSTWPALSLYTGGMIWSVWQSVVLDLDVWDTLWLNLKVDAAVSPFANPQSATGQVRLVGNVGSIFTPAVNGSRIWLSLEASYVWDSVS